MTVTKTEKTFEFKNAKEFFEKFVMTHTIPIVDCEPIDEGNITYRHKEAEEGKTLDTTKYWEVTITDNVTKQKYNIKEMVENEFEKYPVETPENMRMPKMEWLLRQISKLNRWKETFWFERPKEPSNRLFRVLKPDEKAKYAPIFRINVRLIWIGGEVAV